jgi:hypothetical protein
MSSLRSFCLLVALLLLIPLGSSAQTDDQESSSDKDYSSPLSAYLAPDCQRIHDVGNIVFGISNFGRIGAGAKPYGDCLTGSKIPGGEFPKSSNTTYLYKGALWVGAVVGRDTLVSCGSDFNTRTLEMHSDMGIIYRSSIDPSASEFEGAVSEQDYVAVYTDTFTRDALYISGRGHKPLGIAVTQKSYQWSYGYAQDFAIIEFTVKNIGNKYLKDVYLGIYMDMDVHSGGRSVTTTPPILEAKGITEGRDDLTGFLYDYLAVYGSCEYRDAVGVAWTADNNGDYQSTGTFDVPNVTGVRILGRPFKLENMSYNWWVYNYNPAYDYGPQKRWNYRDMGNGSGTPYGDANKYALMSNHEIDFPQPYTFAISEADRAWVYFGNRGQARSLSSGGDNQWVLSVGPYNLNPGDEAVLPVAYVGGENFHSDYRNGPVNLGNNYRPDEYMSNVDLSGLAHNAMTASWIFDNPGVDTDGDLYFGEKHVCVTDSALVGEHWTVTAAETTWYQGDGVPDLAGAAPPPAPTFWVTPTVNGLHVRFNGSRSETTKDAFSRIIDFEGYRVYLGRDERATSFSVVASYDRENYDKMVYNPAHKPTPQFELRGIPLTLSQLRCLYGNGLDPCNDQNFDPVAYTGGHPLVHPQYPDSIFYFVDHDFNLSEFGVSTPIRKVYPHEPKPNPTDQITPDQLTDDGYLKYYEYETDIENLLPTVPYYVNVTAFDFGSPETGLLPLESSKSNGAIVGYAAGSGAELNGGEKRAYVYPNPYRADVPYREMGFEGRMREDMPDYRVYQINFANLPPTCTIKIFTLDGDLVREIEHDFSPTDPAASHDTWDLITRNRQLVVSGLYYWTVEGANGSTQVGKLVILF